MEEPDLASSVAPSRDAQDDPGGDREPDRVREADGASQSDDLPLPEGSRIVHIGPHKTGTTAIQAALWDSRQRAEEQGVHYASNGRHALSAVLAGIEHTSPWAGGKRPPPRWLWTRLLNDVRSSKAKRVVLSSEYFADAQPAGARRVIEELDPERVQIVVTIRPLARIFTSQWQQFVRNQNTTPFDDFVRRHLDDPHPAEPPVFWRRHRHDDLVARWIELAGADRVTVVALNDTDRDMVLRAFERLTGLRPGTLQADPTIQNRSLTLPEIETIRAFNVAFKEAKLPSLLYQRVMRFGATHLMQQRTPPADEPRIELPDWSTEPIAAIAAEMMDNIRATGVRVVGDLDDMLATPAPRVGPPPEVSVSPEVAASAALGVLIASGLARGTAELGVNPEVEAEEGMTPPQPPPVINEPPELLRVSSVQMGLVMLRRVRASALGRVRALRGGARR